MKVCCVYSLESPQRGDSNENTQYTISQCKKENHPKLSQICNYGTCSKGLKNEFETAVVNKSSVFEPLKFHCISPAKRETYSLTNDRRPVIYLATNHFVSKTVFRITNTTETTKRQVCRSDVSKFPPLHCNRDVYMYFESFLLRENDTPFNVMEMKIDIKRRHSNPCSGLSRKSLQLSIVSIGAQLSIC